MHDPKPKDEGEQPTEEDPYGNDDDVFKWWEQNREALKADMDDDEWNLRENDYNLWKTHKEDEDKGPKRPKRTRLKEKTSPLNASKKAKAGE